MSDAEPQPGVERRKVATNESAFLAALAAKGCTSDIERAAFLGMPRRSVYRYIKGEVDPRLHTARRIANRLGAQIDELWPAA
jgi:DNA-binding XRE family transcriptional regulator